MISRRRIFAMLAGLTALGTARSVAAVPDPVERIVEEMRRNGEDAGSAEQYADAISEREIERRIAEINEWVMSECRRGERDADEIAAEAARRLSFIERRPRPRGSVEQGREASAPADYPRWSAKR